MTELTDLLLNDTGDLMLAEHEDGEVDLVLWTGAETVLQAVATRVRIALGSVWYNRQAGIDHEFLFFSRNLSTFVERLQPIARGAFRRAILETDGVVGFEKTTVRGEIVEPDVQFEVDSRNRSVRPIIPCIEIDCANSVTRGVIPEQFGPAIFQGDAPSTLAPVATYSVESHFPSEEVDPTNIADLPPPGPNGIQGGSIFVTFSEPVDISTLPTSIDYLFAGTSAPISGWTRFNGNTYTIELDDAYTIGTVYSISYALTVALSGATIVEPTTFSWEPIEVFD